MARPQYKEMPFNSKSMFKLRYSVKTVIGPLQMRSSNVQALTENRPKIQTVPIQNAGQN